MRASTVVVYCECLFLMFSKSRAISRESAVVSMARVEIETCLQYQKVNFVRCTITGSALIMVLSLKKNLRTTLCLSIKKATRKKRCGLQRC